MRIVAMTGAGVNKTENEDRIIIGKTILTNGVLECENANGFIAIADGVGGNNAGAVASHFVANRIGELTDCAKDKFMAINRDLIDASNKNEQLHKMATTLSGIFTSAESLVCFHIGNTRVYSVQSGKYLKQLTEDDTTLNHLLKTGQLSADDVEQFSSKNEIIACFGAGNENLFDIKITSIPNVPSSMFILTSDGVHEYVSVDDLEDILSECGDAVSICKHITEKAVENGSLDDISVVIIYIEQEGR